MKEALKYNKIAGIIEKTSVIFKPLNNNFFASISLKFLLPINKIKAFGMPNPKTIAVACAIVKVNE